MYAGILSPDDPDFETGGDCALRKHALAPWEDVNGVVFEYYNHPMVFVQDHIGIFLEEKLFREKHGQVPDYSEVNLRWLAAEQHFDAWTGKYLNRKRAKEEMAAQRKWEAERGAR